MTDPVFTKVSQKIDAQIDLLSCGETLTPRQIHDLRVTTKQLRACLRLYNSVRAKSDMKRVDRMIKDVAISFAGMRDSHVQVKMLNKILRGQPHVMLQTHRLYEHLECGRSSDVSPDLSRAADSFRGVREQWRETLSCDRPGFVLHGLRNTYEKSRKLGRKALKSDVDNMFHEWRKWEKYYLYQLETISAASTKKGVGYVESLSKLGSKLGRFNDYCVLAGTVSKRAGLFEDTSAADLVLSSIEEEKKTLKAIFGRSYARLFSYSFETCWHKKLGNGVVPSDSESQ